MRTLRAVTVALFFVGALAAPGLGGPPAAIPPEDPAQESIRRSFQEFASRWMRSLEEDARGLTRSLPAQGQPGRQNATYRSIGSDFQIELRPTGSPRAPYVGILRYSEFTHRCADALAAACGVQSRATITEIFRYQNGRWVY
jgi:hypothetical protein